MKLTFPPPTERSHDNLIYNSEANPEDIWGFLRENPWYVLKMNIAWMRSKASHPGGVVLKNPPPASAGDTKDVGSVPGWGSSLRVGSGKLLQYSCLGNPWTEEPSGLLSLGLQRAERDWTCAYTHTHTHTHTQQRAALTHHTFPWLKQNRNLTQHTACTLLLLAWRQCLEPISLELDNVSSRMVPEYGGPGERS